MDEAETKIDIGADTWHLAECERAGKALCVQTTDRKTESMAIHLLGSKQSKHHSTRSRSPEYVRLYHSVLKVCQDIGSIVCCAVHLFHIT